MSTQATCQNSRSDAAPADNAGIEAMLIEIYKTALKTSHVDTQGSFLNIGGNSVNLIEIIDKINEKTGVTVNPRLFFDNSQSSIHDISKAIINEISTR